MDFLGLFWNQLGFFPEVERKKQKMKTILWCFHWFSGIQLPSEWGRWNQGRGMEGKRNLEMIYHLLRFLRVLNDHSWDYGLCHCVKPAVRWFRFRGPAADRRCGRRRHPQDVLQLFHHPGALPGETGTVALQLDQSITGRSPDVTADSHHLGQLPSITTPCRHCRR